jgi:hypothetical protein
MLTGSIFLDATMTVQLALVSLFMIAGAVNHVEDLIQPRDHSEIHAKKRVSLMLWKAVLLVLFLSVLQDGMTLGSWLGGGRYMFANQTIPLRLCCKAVILLLARIALQVESFRLAGLKYTLLSGQPLSVSFL